MKRLNSSVVYTILCGVASGINFLTLILFGRMFSPDDYGVISSWQAFTVNLAAAVTPLQYMLCRAIADEGADGTDTRGGDRTGKVFGIALIVNLIGIAVLLGFGRAFAGYLHITRTREYLVFLFLPVLFNLYILLNGVPQGRQAFLFLGLTGILFYAGKLVFSYLFYLGGSGTTAVVFGQDVTQILCVLLLFAFAKKNIGRGGLKPVKPDGEIRRNYLESFLLYLLVSLYLNNGDVLVANACFEETRVGLYTVAVSLAKISVFLIATPAGTVLLPKVMAARDDAGKQRKILLLAEAVTIPAAVLYNTVFWRIGSGLIPLIYGAEYEAASAYIPTSCIFSVVLGAYWVYYQYAFAKGQQRPFMIMTLLGGAAAALVIAIIHVDLIFIPIVFSGGMLIGMLPIYSLLKTK